MEAPACNGRMPASTLTEVLKLVQVHVWVTQGQEGAEGCLQGGKFVLQCRNQRRRHIREDLRQGRRHARVVRQQLRRAARRVRQRPGLPLVGRSLGTRRHAGKTA